MGRPIDPGDSTTADERTAMPAHRKRPDLRQRNTADRAPVVPITSTGGDVDDPAERAVPPAPRAWLKVTRDAWAVYWRSSVAAVADDVDRPVVRRLFELRDMQARALARYDAMPYVDGSQGQPRANPALADALAIESAAVRLEDRLGLTPKARAQLGVTFNQARLTAADLTRLAQESAPSADVLDSDELGDLAAEWSEA